ncbi:MAG: tetratricopeptide repeat protein [Bryobacteraceae bacterium]
MKRVLAWLSVCWLAMAQERWVQVRSGPFQVLWSGGERQAQEALSQLEQFRYALGRVLSREDLRLPWPLRVVLLRRTRTLEAPLPPRMGRDSYMASLIAEGHPSPEWLGECARLLLEANTQRLPEDVEEGLLDYYSTVRIEGSRLTVGLPPAKPKPSWALIHLLSLHPDYYGKLRPLLYNLQQGLDPEPAWRNALGKTPEQIRREAAAHLAAGQFASETVSGRALNPRTEFRPEVLEAPAGQLALADLRLAQGRSREARALYESVLKAHPGSAQAQEGLGLLALAGGDRAAARQHLEAAMAAGSRNARVWLEAARAEEDPAKALPMLRKAAALNPAWPAPLRLLAERETDAERRIKALSAAVQLAPREAALWRALAEAQEKAGDYRAAARSWAAAEQASRDEAERAGIREIRRTLDQRRREAEEAARRREAEEKEREVARVKEETLRRIREAEAKVNRDAGPPPANVVPWFETERPSARVQGRLRQVDCLRGALRLVIESRDGKLVRLLVRDPSRVVVVGGGQLEFACGPQKQPRAVTIEYFPKPDAALGASGEVATIEYR